MHFATVNQRAARIRNFMCECKTHADAFANPVFLHEFHALWPRQIIQIIEQLFRVFRLGDVQIIPWDFALLDQCTAAPAAPVDDLLIRQNCLVNRVPVHHLGFAIRNAFLQHLQEKPLIPFVILRLTRRKLARPINRQAHRLHLLLHVRDVVIGPLRWRHIVVHRRVFRRHAERIPAHRHQDIKALHAQLARHHIVDGVIAHMAHVQFARWIRQHRTSIKLRLIVALRDGVHVSGCPSGLDVDFEGARGVRGDGLRHGAAFYSMGEKTNAIITV